MPGLPRGHRRNRNPHAVSVDGRDLAGEVDMTNNGRDGEIAGDQTHSPGSK